MVISQQARLNVMDALRNNRLSRGRYTEEFERRMAMLHGKRFASFVNSGTDALRCGLAAMKEHYGWLPNQNVILPALTFVASYNVIAQVGLTPRLVDIELDTYGIAPDKLEVNYGDVAVMPVHLFGQPVRSEVVPWAREHNYRVIDDSCEAMFVKGISDGDVSCFSTYACHVIQTGVGGVAATNDPALADLIFSYANHGRDGAYHVIDQELGNRRIIDARFHFQRMGYSSRATELEAAIGCAELDEWENNLARRRAIARSLHAALSDLPLVLPQLGSSHMMFPIRCEDRDTRDRLVMALEAGGIATRPLLPLISQPYIKAIYGDLSKQYPNAWTAETTGFYVGNQPSLTSEDVARVSETAHRFFN